jgi:hypothetical protein
LQRNDVKGHEIEVRGDCLRSRGRSAALAACLFMGFPMVALGEPTEIDLRDVPGLEKLEVGATGDGSGTLSVLRGGRGDIALTDARAVVDEMGIGISAGAILRAPADASGIRMSASGLEFFLDGKPASDATCDWIDRVDVINLRDVVVSFPTTGGFGLSRLSLASLAFQSNDATSPCATSGIVTVTDLKMTMQDGSGIVFDRGAFRISAPGVSDAPGTDASTLPSFDLSALVIGFEYRRSGEVPAFGFSETEVRFSATSDSLAPLAAWIGRMASRESPVPGALDVMQAWNVLTAINGSLQVSAPVIRIYAPGVVPSEMVANFSRAGLSTVSGSASLSLDVSDRVFDAGAKMSLTGLVDASVSLAGGALPYGREKMEAAATGREIGWHLLPDVLVEAGSLTWFDTGLDRAVIDIGGVPSGRQLEEIAALVSTREGDAASVLLGAVASFLRLAADGEALTATIAPSTPKRLSSLMFGILTAPLDMVGEIGFALKR